ncbi:MAG: hypothetical protein KF850_04880 [Labilithrix sp.]|nr:hypothetical protein [Labilithrix sp.]MBX3211346.1 hypothetical protein [Labilithrix sp.]
MYRLATRLGSGIISHSIEGDALVVTHEKNGRRVVVPFGDVTTLNLREELPGAWTLHIRRRGGGTIVVPARHFVGFGQFELRAREYRAFVDQLGRACRAANPGVRYTRGSSGLFVLGVVLLVMLGALGVMLVYGLATGHGPPRRSVFVAVPAGLLVAVAFLKQGRAKPFDPAAIPEELLPPF